MMKILFTLLVFHLALAHEREDGIIYENESYGLRLWYPGFVMKSLDFPQRAPHTMIQTWRYLIYISNEDMNDKPKALKIQCNRMYIPKDDSSCGEYTLNLRDGEHTTDFCGEVAPFTMFSKTHDITFTLKTGPRGGAMVNCTVSAVYLTQDKQEVTTTTTARPVPTKPSYMVKETEEIDSSEDGGAPGKRKTSCPCGWSNKVASRIVNGTETLPNEFPFAAGLVYRESNWRFCGATIITSWHALTASHCTDGKPAEQLGLLVGEHDVTDAIAGPTDVIPIENIVQHHEYKTKVWKNDIALLILERQIMFSPHVGPACLPTKPINLENQYVKIIGWGANVFQGAQSAVLKKVNVRVVPIKECNYMYSSVDPVRQTQICTYRRMRASCQGDSGGPVVWLDPETNRYTHVGIVSFGRICGDISPSVHASVGAYLDWIHHYINASKPGKVCTKV